MNNKRDSKSKGSSSQNPITSQTNTEADGIKTGSRDMKKTFKQMADQLERIYKLYYRNNGQTFGTSKMLERAERFFFHQQNIGLCF